MLYPPTVNNLNLFYDTVEEGRQKKWAYVGSDLEGGIFVELDFERGLLIGTGVMYTAYALSGTFLTGSAYTVSQDLPIISRAITAQFRHPQYAFLKDEATKKLAIKSYVDIVYAINYRQVHHDVEEKLKNIVKSLQDGVWDLFSKGEDMVSGCICGRDDFADQGPFEEHFNKEHKVRDDL